MTKVKKRDGSEEEFSESKLKASIRAACDDCDIPDDRGKELVEQVAGRVAEEMEREEEVHSQAIRSRVLRELDDAEPVVSEAWREFDRENKNR